MSFLVAWDFLPETQVFTGWAMVFLPSTLFITTNHKPITIEKNTTWNFHTCGRNIAHQPTFLRPTSAIFNARPSGSQISSPDGTNKQSSLADALRLICLFIASIRCVVSPEFPFAKCHLLQTICQPWVAYPWPSSQHARGGPDPIFYPSLIPMMELSPSCQP